MNRDEAQFILRAYRANSEDACDAQFEPALAQAKRDPELAQWLAEELAFDAVFAGKIRSAIPVPPDLRRQLLLARTTAQGTPWGRRGWSALAASMAILIGAAGTLWQRTATLTEMRQFRAAMVQASMDTNGHSDVKGIGVEELRRWLVSNGGEQEYVLPAELADKEVTACKIIAWQNMHVTMLCYKFGNAHLDLFVTDASGLPKSIAATAQFASTGELSTAIWRREGNVYLIVSSQSQAQLRRMI